MKKQYCQLFSLISVWIKRFFRESIGFIINIIITGVYLPLLWEQSFCIRTPIALGYTRGHFSALVPIEPYSRIDSRPPMQHNNMNPDHLRSTFLPLMDRDRKLLPIHFLVESEVTINSIKLYYFQFEKKSSSLKVD